MDEDARALDAEALGDKAADAVGRAGDEDGLAREAHGYPFSRLREKVDAVQTG